MSYVEVLRARRALTWIFAIEAALVLIAVVSLAYALRGGPVHDHGSMVLSALLAPGAFLALIAATALAPGLSAEGGTIALLWTRPATRDRIAWAYVAVDALAILIAYVGGILLAAVPIGIVFALFHARGQMHVDTGVAVTELVLSLGAAFMWYALISLAASRLPGRGPLLAGASWGVFVIAAGLTQAPFPPWLHAAIMALNLLNPLVYLGGIRVSDGVTSNTSVIAMTPEARAICAWAIAVVAIFLDARLWSTREA